MLSNIYENFEKATDERPIKAVIGITKPKFEVLVNAFEHASLEVQKERVARKEIKRLPRGGVKGPLDTPRKQLFFILYYLKTYMTFDVLALHLNMSVGHTHDLVKHLLRILQHALGNLGHLPARQASTVEELQRLLAGLEGIALDGVEVPCVRPQDAVKQKQYYSGKKKRHVCKTITIADATKCILFLSFVFAGSRHDYALLKSIFLPELPWFDNITVLMDLGFFGAITDYGANTKIKLPHKKPRKSKKNPNPQLTDQQKKDNRAHAKKRVVVEHAIGGMKIFHCLVHRIRNHLDPIIDSFFWLSAGLWNLKIA